VARTLDPIVLAGRISNLLELGGQPRLPRAFRESLAMLIGQGIGVIRFGDLAVVQLRPVLNAHPNGVSGFEPTLLLGRAPKRRRKVHTLAEMRDGLRHLVRFQGTIPGAAEDCVAVPDGVYVEVVDDSGQRIFDSLLALATTFEDWPVHWLRVADIPVGATLLCAVHDVTKPERTGPTVLMYQHFSPGDWVRVEFDGSADVVDLPAVLAILAGKGEPFTEVTRLDGALPPFRNPIRD
jgi:hypothetical protein